MSTNNILQPVSTDFNIFVRENPSVFFNSITPAALPSTTNVTFQFDQFGNVSACVAASGGSSLSLETKGVANGSQTLLNLAAANNVTLTDNGSGTVTVGSSVPGANAQVPMTDGAGNLVAGPITVFGSNLFATGNYVASGSIEINSGQAGFYATTVNGPNVLCFNSTGGADFTSISITGAQFNQDLVLHLNTVNGGGFDFRIGNAGGTAYTTPVAITNTLLTAPALALTASTLATSATAGAASALPATPLTYVEMTVTISGTPTVVKIPAYAV